MKQKLIIKNTFCLLMFFYALSSCTNNKKINKSKDIVKSNDSLVIFVNNKAHLPLAISKEISYHNLEEKLNVSNKKFDTLQIHIGEGQFVYFSHKNLVKDSLFLGKGDTLLIDVFHDDIVYTIKSEKGINEKYRNLIYTLQSEKEYKEIKEKIRILTKEFYVIDKEAAPMTGHNDFEKFINYPLKVNRSGLGSNSQKTQELVNLYKLKYTYEIKFLSVRKSKLHKDFVLNMESMFLINFYDSLLLLYNLFPSRGLKDEIDSKLFINDSLIYNPYSKRILYSYLIRNVIKSKPEYSRSRQYINYVEAFDNIPTYFNDSLSKYAQFLSIEAMANFGEPFSNTKDRFEKFKNQYKDNRLNKILVDKYLFDIDRFSDLKTDIMLINNKREIYTLSSLMENLKGNLIYVDFWASWCAPCRQATPEAKKLMSDLKNQNFKYIFLSLDIDIEKWMIAENADGINTHPYSFMILNTKDANFIKEIKLNEIPRYLIFDFNSKLINENAPGPKGQEIRKLLEGHIN